MPLLNDRLCMLNECNELSRIRFAIQILTPTFRANPTLELIMRNLKMINFEYLGKYLSTWQFYCRFALRHLFDVLLYNR